MTRSCVLALVLLAWPSLSAAHEVRPAYLEIKQTDDEHYDLLWKVPGLGDDMRLGIYVELPANCRRLGEAHSLISNHAFIERWSVACEGGLVGRAIDISGLSATVTDVLARIEHVDGTTQVARLSPAATTFTIEAEPGPLEVAGTYFRLGVEHILTGVDHLLFVLALVILVSGVRRLIATVTAFTLAHSLTLAAATLGFVHVPQPPVEACIALSIVFVAAEIVRERDGLTARFPWVIAFTFGLLHGFGFAGALSEVGLPQRAIPVALLFFNVGVEAGQLLFIAAVLSVFAASRSLLRSSGLALPRSAWRVPPYAIGTVAAFWVVERASKFV